MQLRQGRGRIEIIAERFSDSDLHLNTGLLGHPISRTLRGATFGEPYKYIIHTINRPLRLLETLIGEVQRGSIVGRQEKIS